MNPTLEDLLRIHRDSPIGRPERRLNWLDQSVRSQLRYPSRWQQGFKGSTRGFYSSVAAEIDRWNDSSEGELSQALAQQAAAFLRRKGSIASSVALASVVASRVTGLVPNPRQIEGARLLHLGCLVEMATGEGKTLTVALAAVGAAWAGKPLHIITANDYLASRDCEWLSSFYQRCGCSSAALLPAMDPEARRTVYACDIVYGTSKEIVADYLRDQLRLGPMVHQGRRLVRIITGGKSDSALIPVQRGLHAAFVDEADHVLIDDAVTPLLISRKVENKPLNDAVRWISKIVWSLQKDLHYTPLATRRAVELTAKGRGFIRDLLAAEGQSWLAACQPEELAETALQAREFFQRDQHYIVDDGKVVIVEESTGRPMPDRTWKHGLHQAVEALEDLEISPPSETAARISFQRFFRKYRHLAGLTGTGWEARREFWDYYGLHCRRVPTHLPCQRREGADCWTRDQDGKETAILHETEALHRKGRPVLIGTRSVHASERYAAILQAAGLEVSVLNARNLAEEAAIIARAGESGRITIATNMAGRGTDIKLARAVCAGGGLHVIATERHLSRRIDRQLFGRAGRQGDPGSAGAFLSPEDELFSGHHAPFAVLFTKLVIHFPDSKLRRWALAQITERIQSAWTAAEVKKRRSVARTDDWLENSFGDS